MSVFLQRISHALSCLAVLCLLLGVADPVEADVIDVPLGGSFSGFSASTYRGQTFVALPGKAEELTFYVGPSPDAGGVNFHVLLTEIDTSGGFVFFPTTVLFESATLNTGVGAPTPSPTPFTVELGGIPLVAGQTYAWILDAYVELASNGNNSADTGLASIFDDIYPDGVMISRSLGPFPTGTRDDHFASGLGASHPRFDLAFTLTFSEPAIEVVIDIKPGSDPNSINLCSSGAVPAAILGSDTFIVDDVDPNSLRFADASVKMVGMKDPRSLCSFEDVNFDGFTDLVCHFLTTDIAGVGGQTTTAKVNGALFDGTLIEGSDSVNIVKDTCY